MAAKNFRIEVLSSTTIDNQLACTFLLTNGKISATITNYGATIISLKTPDRYGLQRDVLLGFDTAEEYAAKKHPYFGSTVGRYANRIGTASFALDGSPYKLTKNFGEHQLHGGEKGFDKKVWHVDAAEANAEGVRLAMTYTSPDGEEGYPGTLKVTATYQITEADEVAIGYIAQTDKATVVNLTNHAYFNLAGEGNGDVLSHVLMIDADTFTPCANSELIPTGELLPVAGLPLDFRRPARIGARIAEKCDTLAMAKGYDHNLVLNSRGSLDIVAARAEDKATGRVLELRTTLPAVQLYTGNWLSEKGKGGKYYGEHSGFCLETQRFPDTPNRKEFPSVVLRPGQTYHEKTIWKFSTSA
jgi:aldose 1-epimerase